ncbi:hypothetical protein C8R43DRAFT_957835 [Mycena crocata]|nr:hypothetical protein C8R43DRAFT_957835 [Mycena crocata]
MAMIHGKKGTVNYPERRPSRRHQMGPVRPQKSEIGLRERSMDESTPGPVDESRLSGPADLRKIASVCFLFYSIPKANPSCWYYTRARLSIPLPPLSTIHPKSKQSPLPTSAFRDLATSEKALIEYIFGGANCTVCGVWSLNLPYSFALNWRRSLSLASSINAKNLVRIKTSDIPAHPVLLWFMGPEASSEQQFVGIKSEMTAAKVELKTLSSFMTESQMRTFNALECWKPRYLQAVGETRILNLEFLKTVALRQRRAVHKLLKCPTLLRVFNAFNRDLTRMGTNDWRVIKDVVGRELKKLDVTSKR